MSCTLNAFRRIQQQYGIKGVTIRNDNGSQFIANSVKQYLRAAEANQKFTHVATPEENFLHRGFSQHRSARGGEPLRVR